MLLDYVYHDTVHVLICNFSYGSQNTCLRNASHPAHSQAYYTSYLQIGAHWGSKPNVDSFWRPSGGPLRTDLGPNGAIPFGCCLRRRGKNQIFNTLCVTIPSYIWGNLQKYAKMQ